MRRKNSFDCLHRKMKKIKKKKMMKKKKNRQEEGKEKKGSPYSKDYML